MKKNIPLLLILSLLCAFTLFTFHLPELTSKGKLSVADRSTFIDFSQGICLFIGAGLFTILVFSSPTENRNEIKRFSSRVWIIGVISILGITTVSVLIFNPMGAFTWNIGRVSYLNTRLLKIYHYNLLNSTPDIIFLGTSVSIPIPAEEYAKRFSLTGFNFSVLGGTVVDYSTLTNVILSKSTPDEKPPVLITEILSPSLSPSHIGVKYYLQYPIEYAAHYMPLDFAFETISTQLDDIFILSSFSQILYVEYFILNKQQPKISAPILDQDEEMLSPTQQDEATYKTQLIAYSIGQLDKLLRCNELNSQGKDAISRMVTLSKQQHVSIVFYRSPINDDFYKVMKKTPKFYEPCGKKLNRFMEQIQSENPNVFYLDLSHYAAISSGGQALYMDSHHLNLTGTERVLEVLTPTIQKAIEYARSQ